MVEGNPVEDLIDVLLDALAEAPFEYSEQDCVEALIKALNVVLEADEPFVLH